MHQLLADSAAELFRSEVTPDVLEAAGRGEWPERLWDVLTEAEYPRLFADADGDVTWEEAFPIVSAAGKALAPVPLPEMLLATWVLRRLDITVPDGIVVVVPPREREPWQARWNNGGYRISGAAVAVPWGSRASHLVISARSESGQALLALVDRDSVTIGPGRNAAGEPRDSVAARDAIAIAVAPVATRLPDDVVLRFGALVRAAQIAGAVGRLLHLSTAYARERSQFGRPIAQFQAISQQLAVLAEEAIAADVAVAAAWRAAARDPATPSIAIAKVRAGKAAGIAPAIAHAVFGAIGITGEHSLHFATQRLWSWRAEFGHEAYWARELGASALRAGGSTLWQSLTQATPAVGG